MVCFLSGPTETIFNGRIEFSLKKINVIYKVFGKFFSRIDLG